MDTATQTVSSSSVDSQLSFSCAQCLVSYATSEEQRCHMRSDWHVYNLKRRIALIAPISSFDFKAHVQAQAAEDALGPKEESSCRLCQKSYQTPKQLKGHLRSQRHAQELAKQQYEIPVTLIAISSAGMIAGDHTSEALAESSEDFPDYDSTICLFCNLESDSTAANVGHMSKTHSLFLPDQEYLIDLESLLGYLYFLIAEFNECLYCGAIKGSMESAQHHMTSKGHCMINFDEKSKLEEFYDYPKDVRTQKVAATSATSATQLQLPSGKMLGHRYHAHLHKHCDSSRSTSSDTAQRLLTSAPSAISPASPRHNSQALVMRSSDSQGLIGISDTQRRSLRAVEKKMMNMETRARKQYQRKLEMVGNKQKHFKSDVPGPKLG